MKEELKPHEIFNMAYCYRCEKHVFPIGCACPHCGALSFYEDEKREEESFFRTGWYWGDVKGEENECK